ncbi:SDR family oxidoreductase [Burkholderia alba]|uniref:SDR family oxidoreductase n=1 Tax=Burkholderia alba TaxID=2683677 RepID=UPI002B0534B5|nr:SDR family oxidoreductase [Burkholderia alba]
MNGANSDGRFADRTFIVTGAARGIGEAAARLLADEGAHVHALDVAADALHAWCGALDPATARRIRPHVADIRDAQAIGSLIAALDDERPIDGLVNAAGVLSAGAFLSTDADAWRRMLDINAFGTLVVTQAAAARMTTRRRGAIVTVASNAGATPRFNLTAYCASKAAAAMLTRCAGLELAGYGIRCNVVSPGSTDTPMLAEVAGTGPERDARSIAGDPAMFRGGIPLGKIATARDIAQSIAFLLSDEAGHITMRELVVDGGATF